MLLCSFSVLLILAQNYLRFLDLSPHLTSHPTSCSASLRNHRSVATVRRMLSSREKLVDSTDIGCPVEERRSLIRRRVVGCPRRGEKATHVTMATSATRARVQTPKRKLAKSAEVSIGFQRHTFGASPSASELRRQLPSSSPLLLVSAQNKV